MISVQNPLRLSPFAYTMVMKFTPLSPIEGEIE